MSGQTYANEDKYKTLMLIWAAMLFSQLMFVVLAVVVKPDLFRFDLKTPVLGESPAMVLAFAAASLSDLALSFVFRKKFLDQSVAEQDVSRVQMALIVGCALAEAISLLGLILAFAFSYQYFFLFSALGIVAVILHFPRRKDVQAASFAIGQ